MLKLKQLFTGPSPAKGAKPDCGYPTNLSESISYADALMCKYEGLEVRRNGRVYAGV
jgi:hypothetical protein